jgi:hypothetical protein
VFEVGSDRRVLLMTTGTGAFGLVEPPLTRALFALAWPGGLFSFLFSYIYIYIYLANAFLSRRLNLTAANRIFITELQWNPSVENQAISRAIRLRQKDKVLVTRYVIKDSVEVVSPAYCQSTMFSR